MMTAGKNTDRPIPRLAVGDREGQDHKEDH